MVRPTELTGFQGKGAIEGSSILCCWTVEVQWQVVGDGHRLSIGNELVVKDGEGRKGNGERSEGDVSPFFRDSGMKGDFCGLALSSAGFKEEIGHNSGRPAGAAK
jgi:hypothetical protein